ncbi:hypothetical protein Ddye_015322 [Dipteronia dyeriana]|uniref:DUF4218 domain-containing protein n=1 Tax=Dipteronia dyeriana TaxID=168575 RepID=A0AAD9U5B5_9ROSI|nr:hypothetical protein Ddye_015322 [Dipteronia dyeriana]
MHIKVLNHWSNKSFDTLLQFFKDILPEGLNIPMSLYNAKKMLRDLGLGYVSIHACKHDCALFWKEHARADNCPVCNESTFEIDDGKGSIAEAYMVNESLTFCSLYLGAIETKFNRHERNDDKGKTQQECVLSIFSQKTRPLGAS